jgi:hypothetical protein
MAAAAGQGTRRGRGKPFGAHSLPTAEIPGIGFGFVAGIRANEWTLRRNVHYNPLAHIDPFDKARAGEIGDAAGRTSSRFLPAAFTRGGILARCARASRKASAACCQPAC